MSDMRTVALDPGEAVRAVVNEYQGELGRKPSREEWEALLRAVLGNELPEFRCMEEGVVAEVSLDLK